MICRADISKAQQSVQSGHAVAQWLCEHGVAFWSNETLIYYSAENGGMLKRVANVLARDGVRMSAFWERPETNPGIASPQMTAIAFHGDHQVLKLLKLQEY